MKSNFYRFEADELIKTYKQKIREQKLKDDQDMDTANKALYETVLFEIDSTEKAQNGKKKQYKEFFLNLDVLLDNVIKEQGIMNGFLICSADAPTASVYVNHFEQGAMTDLSKALRKRYSINLRKKIAAFKEMKQAKELQQDNVDLCAAAKATAIGRSALVLITLRGGYRQCQGCPEKTDRKT